MSCHSEWKRYVRPNPRSIDVNTCTMGGGLKSSEVHESSNNTTADLKIKEKQGRIYQYDLETHFNNEDSSAAGYITSFPNYSKTNNDSSFFIGDGLVDQGNPSSVASHPSAGFAVNDNEIIAPRFCTPLASKRRAKAFCNKIGDTSGTIYMVNSSDLLTSTVESNAALVSSRFGNTNFGTFKRQEWEFKTMPGSERVKAVSVQVLISVAIAIVSTVAIYAVAGALSLAVEFTGGLAAAPLVAGASRFTSVISKVANIGGKAKRIAKSLQTIDLAAGAGAGAGTGAGFGTIYGYSSFAVFRTGLLSLVKALPEASLKLLLRITSSTSLGYGKVVASQAGKGFFKTALKSTLTTRLGISTVTGITAVESATVFAEVIRKLIDKTDYWKNSEDSAGRKSCIYDSSNRVRYLYFDKKDIAGCCNITECGIAGGTKLVCKRVAYNGDPVVCCLNDFAINLDNRDTCFQTPARQRTCAPRYRDLSSTECMNNVYKFCSGEILFAGQTDWTDLWSRKNININDLMAGDEYDTASKFWKKKQIKKYLSNEVTIKKSNICLNAIVRWMFPDQLLKTWDDFKNITINYEDAIVLNGADINGLALTIMLIDDIFDRFLSEGGSIFSQIDSDGITNREFSDNLFDICKTVPSLCKNRLNSICKNYKIDDLKLNPKIMNWCGCYLNQEEYNRVYGRYQVSTECLPICNNDSVIPIVTDNFTKKVCTQSICIIDQITLDIMSTSIKGGIQFEQICSGCTRYNTKYSNNYKYGYYDPEIEKPEDLPSFLYQISTFTKNSIDPRFYTNKNVVNYLYYYGFAGVDFTKDDVINSPNIKNFELTDPDFAKELIDYLKDIQIEKPKSIVCTSIENGNKNCTNFLPYYKDELDYKVLNNRTNYTIGLGLYQSSINLFLEDNVYSTLSQGNYSNTELIYFYTLLSTHYITPVVLIKAKIENNSIFISHREKWKNVSSGETITDLSEYCFSLVDLLPVDLVTDVNYFINSDKGGFGGLGSNNTGILNAPLVLMIPIHHLTQVKYIEGKREDIYYDDWEDKFKFTLDATFNGDAEDESNKTYWSNRALPHSYSDFKQKIVQQNLHLVLTDNSIKHNTEKVDLTKLSFNYMKAIKKFLNITQNENFDAKNISIYNLLTANQLNFDSSWYENQKKLQRILEMEKSVNFREDSQQCTCLMNDMNFNIADSIIDGSLKLSQNCTGDNKCYNSEGDVVSCSSKLADLKFDIIIENGGSGIEKIDLNKIDVLLPSGLNKPIFISYELSPDGKLTSLKVENYPNENYSVLDVVYNLDFSNAISNSLTDFVAPVVNFQIQEIDEDEDDKPNDRHNPKNNISKDFIGRLYKDRNNIITLVLGFFLFILFIMYIALKPSPIKFVKNKP